MKEVFLKSLDYLLVRACFSFRNFTLFYVYSSSFFFFLLDERRATSQRIENDISEAEEVVNEMSLASSYSKSDWSHQIDEFEDEISQWRNQFRAVGFL